MAARDLASSSSRTRAAGPRSAPATPSALAAKYRSLFVIGRGGMGAVEAALEVGPTEGEKGAYQRVVALKRLLPDSARDARRAEMFLREARLAALLDHPNVVRAFDYGELDGELFLALEYIEGQPLSRVLRAIADAGGALGVSLTAHVLAEACEGLHAAHELRDEAGQALALVHRDVSPQNIMLSYDGQVRLLDFGVAKIDSESVTKTGEVKGKTAYMSPEQAMGDAIDRRSDLFSLGAVLFECLTLKRMWGDGTDMDVIRKLALESPPRLEDVMPTRCPEIAAIYTRLVAREASGRPATAHDVASELRMLVPEGREAAARAVRALLERHFAGQAEEQHCRLTSALEEVAPEQARELRESVSPDPETLVTHARNAVDEAARSTASAAPVTRSSRRWPWLAAAALVVVAIVAWRQRTPPADASPPSVATSFSAAPPAPAPARASASAPALAPASASAVASAPASASASALASAVASASAPAPASALAPARAPSPGSARVLAQPTPSLRPAVSLAPAPIPAPATSAKPPPDVDENAF